MIPKGWHHSQKTKDDLSKLFKGVSRPLLKGKHRSEETKKKIGSGNKGKVRTQEVKDRIRQTLKSHPLQYTEEYRAKRRTKMLGNKLAHRTPETTSEKRRKADMELSAKRRGKSPHKQTDKTRALLSNIAKRAWLDPEFRDKSVKAWMRSNRIKPNKQEIKLDVLLSLHFPNEWKFVGDGQLIIGGKCPDFANINGKKALLEHYGDFWHKDDNVQKRADHFARYGYKCLVIWEHELKDPDKIISKVKEHFYV